MYPVDLHMHTVASTHAYSNLHDYIAQAKLKGIKLFAITDHGPDMADAPLLAFCEYADLATSGGRYRDTARH